MPVRSGDRMILGGAYAQTLALVALQTPLVISALAAETGPGGVRQAFTFCANKSPIKGLLFLS